MNDQQRESLTESGQTRRDTMLGDLTTAMRKHHRAKRARRSAFASLCLLGLIAGLAFLQWPRAQAPTDEIIVIDDQPAPVVIIQYVRTDPNILDRYSVRPTSRVTYLDDEALLAELVAIGRPAGLIRMGDSVRLTVDVTNPLPKETGPPDQDPSSL